MEKAIVAYAKATGCTRITGGGRLGWNKVLRDYKAAGTFMYKDI
jgi:hypothetical protein